MRVFEETQRFNQWWLWVLYLASLGGVGLILYQTSLQSNNSENQILLVVIFVVMILIYAFLSLIRLFTKIDKEGISYQLYPFHRKIKKVSWKDLSEIQTRKYNPILEFGGWGYRIGFGGKAFNIKGNQGIQLILKNGNRLLIGTQKPQEAQSAIDKWFMV